MRNSLSSQSIYLQLVTITSSRFGKSYLHALRLERKRQLMGPDTPEASTTGGPCKTMMAPGKRQTGRSPRRVVVSHARIRNSAVRSVLFFTFPLSWAAAASPRKRMRFVQSHDVPQWPVLASTLRGGRFRCHAGTAGANACMIRSSNGSRGVRPLDTLVGPRRPQLQKDPNFAIWGEVDMRSATATFRVGEVGSAELSSSDQSE